MSSKVARWDMAARNPEVMATQLGMTAWLRNSATSGDVTSWFSQLDSNHATANAARAGEAQSDSSLLMVAATPDVYAWPIAVSTFNVNYLTFYFWAKPTAVATNQTLLSIHIGTGGASARVLEIKLISAVFRIDVYSSGSNGRRFNFNAQAAAGTSRLWGFEFNKDGATENDRVVGTRGGVVLVPSSVVDLGTGGSPATLVSATGNILLGNFNNSAVASDAYGGQYGRNAFCRAGSVMDGVTSGTMTQTARDALNLFEPLT